MGRPPGVTTLPSTVALTKSGTPAADLMPRTAPEPSLSLLGRMILEEPVLNSTTVKTWRPLVPVGTRQ